MLKLPSAIYAERYLLGVVIRDGLDIKDLSPADFFEPIHQEIAFCIKQINEQGNHPDEVTIVNALRANNSNAQAHLINQLVSETKESRLNQAWVNEIKRTAALRAIAINAQQIQRLASDPNAEPDSIIAYTEGTLKTLVTRDKKFGPMQMNIEAMKSFKRTEDPNCVIGNRWLCKGGSMLLVSQSGVGKSSFALQFLISLCINRQFFGIEAKRPLKVVMMQAENDFGDVAEAYQDITAGLNLTEEEKNLLDTNLIIYRNKNCVGDNFIDSMRSLILQHEADIFLCDPLLSFAGIQVSDQQQMTEFLRHKVDKVLDETSCIMIAVHHTTKPKSAKDKEGQTIADLAYSGAGASELVNWVREVGVLVRMEGINPIFKFSLTKRRGRAGLKDHNNQFSGDIYVRHSRQQGLIRWEQASPEEAQEAPDGETDNSKPSKSKTKTGSGHSDSSNAKGSTGLLNGAG